MGDRISMSISGDSPSDDTFNRGPWRFSRGYSMNFIWNWYIHDVVHFQTAGFLCRYLDASYTSLHPDHFSTHQYLIFMKLSYCNISRINYPYLPNLLILDVSWNQINILDWKDLRFAKNLRVRVFEFVWRFGCEWVFFSVITEFLCVDYMYVYSVWVVCQ